jgi:hypothetical protein
VVSGNNFVRRPSGNSPQHRRSQFLGLNGASERRRGDLVRDANIRSTTHVVSGFREIVGYGEVLIDVGFPVSFIQTPMFVNGTAMAAGSPLVEGSYPVVSAIVAYWDIREPDLELTGSTARKFYKGAQIALTATGVADQRLIFSWQFTGMAIANPLSGQRSVPNPYEQGRAVG